MKIGIVTIYYGMNYGAALQALALNAYLKEQGHEVVFLNTPANHPIKVMRKKIERKRELGQVRGYWYQVKKYARFVQIVHGFHHCEAPAFSQVDVVIFGSDEIWNVREESKNAYPFYFGVGISVRHLISYAPRVNRSEAADFHNYPEYENSLQRVEHLSVRDRHSKEVLEEVLQRNDIEEVVDPTLLMERTFYEKLRKPCHVSGPYALVYTYRLKMPKNRIKKMRTYTADHNQKLVSILEYLDFCDINRTPSLVQMLDFFANAKVVLTDTFHGCIFALIFQKELVVLSSSKTKVTDLLEKFGLTDRILQKDMSIEDVMKNEMDYDRINALIEEKRIRSEEFLFKSIEAS